MRPERLAARRQSRIDLGASDRILEAAIDATGSLDLGRRQATRWILVGGAGKGAWIERTSRRVVDHAVSDAVRGVRRRARHDAEALSAAAGRLLAGFYRTAIVPSKSPAINLVQLFAGMPATMPS